MDTDVVVVGAGLAGLQCARGLVAAGLDVTVLEAADAVGGRIRTDRVDGFLVDRGFQLLNPAYPAVRRHVDVDALHPQPFDAGVAARTDQGATARLGHPVREPGLIGATVATAVRRPREIAAVLRWARPLARPRRASLAAVLDRTPDRTLGAALDAARVDGLMGRVAERFFAGVLLEDDRSTSDHYALILAWMFATGVPFLPREGMQALPEQLAGHVIAAPAGRVRTDTAVDRVEGSVVHLGDGSSLSARAVVVATGAREAGRLVEVDVPELKGVVTTWWACDVAPTSSALLHVDGRTRATGPVVNCAVVSNAAPSYAPRGRHLVQASVLLGPGRDTSEASARRHAAELLGADAAPWEVVARHEVPAALPAQGVPLSTQRPVDLGDGRFVCGDHRDTGSIQGALVSGERTARAVLARLQG